MPDRPRLAVLIVSYESAKELPGCLASVIAACHPDDQIVVVDNASRDDSVGVVRQFSTRLELVANTDNRGFAAAANQAVRLAKQPLSMILNPDTVVNQQAIDELVGCLERNPTAALVGPRLRNGDGSLQASAFRFPTPTALFVEQATLARRWPRFDQGRRAGADITVDWLKGACLLGATETLQRLGPFDERFFMFGEDVDLARRLLSEGRTVVHCPHAEIVHFGGRSTQLHQREMTLAYVRSTYLLYDDAAWSRKLPLAALAVRATAAMKAVRSFWVTVFAIAIGRTDRACHHALELGTFARVVVLPVSSRPAVPAARSAAEPRPAIDLSAAVSSSASAPPDRPAPRATFALSAGSTDEQPAARGSFALLISFAAIAVANYAFAIVMSWLLPVESFGILGVAQALLLISSTIVGAGFPWAAAQLIAKTGDTAGRARAIWTGLLANLALGSVVALIIAGIGLSGAVQPIEAYTPALLVLAVSTVVLSLLSFLSSTLQGLLRLSGLGLIRTAEVVIKAIVGIGLVLLGLGTSGAVLGFLVGSAVATIIAVWLLRDVSLDAGGNRFERSLFSAAGPLFIGMAGFALVSQLDIITVKVFVGDGLRGDLLAGQYQVAITLSRLPFYAAMAVFSAMFPYVARDQGRGDVGQAYARLAIKYTALFVAPTSLVLMTIPDPTIRLFFSDKYDQSATPLLFTAAASLSLTFAYGLSILLQASGRPNRPALALLVAVPAQLVIAALLVPRLGAIGAALALAAASFIVLALVSPAVISAFSLSARIRDLARYGAALMVLAATLALLPHADRISTGLSFVAGVVAYIVSLVLLRLITAADVDILGGALGPHGLVVRRRAAGVIDALQGQPRA